MKLSPQTTSRPTDFIFHLPLPFSSFPWKKRRKKKWKMRSKLRARTQDHWTLYLSRNLDLFLSCSTDLRSGAAVVDNKKGIEMKVTSQIMEQSSEIGLEVTFASRSGFSLTWNLLFSIKFQSRESVQERCRPLIARSREKEKGNARSGRLYPWTTLSLDGSRKWTKWRRKGRNARAIEKERKSSKGRNRK